VSDVTGHPGFMATGDVLAGNEQMHKELGLLLKKAAAG
jgi:hypothetical protein